MSGSLYYLYANDGRYYFHAEENLNKVATDRRDGFGMAEVNAHIVGQLKEAVGRRSDVIVCPRDSADVPEAQHVRLVILPPDASRPTRASEHDDANDLALQILQHRGDAARVRRNTVLFLAARRDEVRDLRNKVRDYLAWDSIVNGETRIDNLSGNRRTQAAGNLRSVERAVRGALIHAFRQALAPVQDDPQRADFRLSVAEINTVDAGGGIVDAAFRRFGDDEALVETISPTALASLLHEFVWGNGVNPEDHIGVDALWDILTSNVYMHRLRNRSVLQRAITQGVPEGAFGYASGYQTDTNYQNLRFREPQEDAELGALAEQVPGLLVSAEMAELVKAEQPPPDIGPTPPDDGDTDGAGTETGPGVVTPPVVVRGPRRIVAVKTVRGDVSLDDIDRLRDEIIRNLRDDGGQVTIEITITAEKTDGFSEGTTRNVRENSDQLGLSYRPDD